MRQSCGWVPEGSLAEKSQAGWVREGAEPVKGRSRPEIVDFGSLPGPTRPPGGLGEAPAGAPLELHRCSARQTNSKPFRKENRH